MAAPVHPTIVVYPGYASHAKVVVSGCIFRQNLRRWYPSSNRFLANVRTMWKLFRVKGLGETAVQLHVGTQTALTVSDERGFFQFELPLAEPLPYGWTAVVVCLPEGSPYGQARAQGKVLHPARNSYDIISDIDDTLLISHSLRPWWKFLLLLTRHPRDRKPFDGVVTHYQQLYESNIRVGPCLFVYVSSSEWNLYPFIRAFIRAHHLPRGVFLLRTLKTSLRELFQTDDHRHKLDRIQDVLAFYPDHRFILLGDDTQQDPLLYMQAVRHCPGQVAGVYIRHARRRGTRGQESMIKEIERLGVPCCYFRHSEEAMEHSIRMGFIHPARPESGRPSPPPAP